MSADQCVFSVLLSSVAGTGAGFCTGLVPGLHVNNLAAVTIAGSASVMGLFCGIGSLFGYDEPALLVGCFLVAAMVAHMFSESIVATYLGIPSGDNVSLLPAHRLAREGLGRSAVRASADGSLAGAVIGLLLLVPVCVLLGPPVDAYSLLREVMGLAVALLSALLVASDAIGREACARRLIKGSAFFLLAGILGFVVLDTSYFAADMLDFPWMRSDFVRRSSLLLPLFAGLFGVPTLVLSIRSDRNTGTRARPRESSRRTCPEMRPRVRLRESVTSFLGGILVGWVPGMTSGSSATLCAGALKGAAAEGGGRDEAVRFIWLYSAISSCGAVLSVGALFVIARARSGIMQAVVFFMGSAPEAGGIESIDPACALLLSMLAAASLSHAAILGVSRAMLMRLQSVLCSQCAALVSLAFVTSLVLLLTGTRGGLLFVTAASLGLMPPLCGSRRINLMGCLLLPIAATFLLG